MIAVVVLPIGISVFSVVGGIALTLAAWVLIAHIAAPKAKRVVVLCCLAVSLATIAPPTVRASEDGEIVMEDPCKKYGPEHPMWWIAGCMWP